VLSISYRRPDTWEEKGYHSDQFELCNFFSCEPEAYLLAFNLHSVGIPFVIRHINDNVLQHESMKCFAFSLCVLTRSIMLNILLFLDMT
jgi:hypothetical protein